jgi:hypothetical protein
MDATGNTVNATGDSFTVQPEYLTDASKKVASYADELGQVRGSVSATPPASAFGQLPESHEFADALAHSVQVSTDALGYASTMANDLGTGMATCAQNYADLDMTHARNINGVMA